MKKDINAMKKQYNYIFEEGAACVDRLEKLHAELISLREEIEKEDPHGYDPIALLFCGTFDIGDGK